MRTAIAVFVLMGAGLLLTAGTNFGQDKKKEVTLKGLICCNKCELGKSDKCQTLIQVKDEKSKEDVSYFFDNAAEKKYHSDICQGAKKGSVTGTVSDDGKKKTITVTKVTYE